MYGFKLTEEARNEGFSGGTINCTPQGHAFDVGVALETNDGIIVTEDANLASVLRSYPALEAVPEEDLPKDPELSGIPVEDAPQAAPMAPPVLQSGTADRPPVSEIPAEHADLAPTIEGELDQGDKVSGQSGSQSKESTTGDQGSKGLGSSSSSSSSSSGGKEF